MEVGEKVEELGKRWHQVLFYALQENSRFCDVPVFLLLVHIQGGSGSSKAVSPTPLRWSRMEQWSGVGSWSGRGLQQGTASFTPSAAHVLRDGEMFSHTPRLLVASSSEKSDQQPSRETSAKLNVMSQRKSTRVFMPIRTLPQTLESVCLVHVYSSNSERHLSCRIHPEPQSTGQLSK